MMLKDKTQKPIIALCYDFDKTLSPNDMQAQGYIQSVGYDIGDFWKKSNGLAARNDMDQNLAYMYTMKEEASGKVLFTKKELANYGERVTFFSGVEEWFERIKRYGEERGIIIEHYIISSGLKEMIEGTSLAKNGAFKRIYATSFYYDKNNVAVWPAQVVNYTNKTQFLFRIVKGVLDINDFSVNDAFTPEEIRIPFRNMIYIGDSDTDIPCMKLVNSRGGYSIGVFNPDTQDKTKVYKMIRDERIKYYAPADYSEGAELDNLIKTIINRTVYNEKLERSYYHYKKEAINQVKEVSAENQYKNDLISSLESSGNFANTHKIIKELAEYDEWTNKEIETLVSIGLNNSQVFYILGDKDINNFYQAILKNSELNSDNIQKMKKKLNENN